MKTRKGMGHGQGTGFKNIIPLQDSNTHANNAKGIKMPQSTKISNLEAQVELYRQKIDQARQMRAQQAELAKLKEQALKEEKALKKELEKEKEQLTKVKTESEFVRKAKELGAEALEKGKEVGKEVFEEGKKFASEAKDFAKKEYEAMKEKKRQDRIKELAEVNHPIVKKIERQQERVNTLKEKVAESDDDRLVDELAEEESQLRGLQEDATDIHLEDFNDAELRTLAIRHKGSDSFFGFSDDNPYKQELVRRIQARKVLDAEISKAEKGKPEESTFGGMFTGLIEW